MHMAAYLVGLVHYTLAGLSLVFDPACASTSLPPSPTSYSAFPSFISTWRQQQHHRNHQAVGWEGGWDEYQCVVDVGVGDGESDRIGGQEPKVVLPKLSKGG
ncbi:Hypothetical protein NocV09_02100080 [Nannochloropsis oceanica]